MDGASPIAAVAVAALLVTVGVAALLMPAPDDAGAELGPSGDGEDRDDGETDEPREDGTAPLVELVDVDKPTEMGTWPVVSPDGTEVGNRTWRIVGETGNCCENYITTTPRGRIVDLGGTFPIYSDDDGRTWTRVQGVTPFVNGEGALTVAPDGDVVSVMWDPYSGDRLVSYKWDADTATWSYAETPLKTPFFDRPWLSVVPGPVEGPDGTHDYAVYLRGGWPSKEVGYVSFDGLHYLRASSPSAESLLAEATPLDGIAAEPWADWVQPHTESDITPLPGGGALAHQGLGSDCAWTHFSTDVTWSCAEDTGLGDGRALVDSRGRLHEVDADGTTVAFRTSADAGAHWNATEVTLPGRYEIEDWDAKVNAELGQAVVAVHAHDSSADADQDMVLRFDVSGDEPELVHRALVGDGDLGAGSGLGGDNRFDFTTVGFLPDGRVVVSFADADRHPPHLAVQTSPQP